MNVHSVHIHFPFIQHLLEQNRALGVWCSKQPLTFRIECSPVLRPCFVVKTFGLRVLRDYSPGSPSSTWNLTLRSQIGGSGGGTGLAAVVWQELATLSVSLHYCSSRLW